MTDTLAATRLPVTALIATSFVMTYVIAPRLRNGEICDADDPTTCGEVSKISRVPQMEKCDWRNVDAVMPSNPP